MGRGNEPKATEEEMNAAKLVEIVKGLEGYKFSGVKAVAWSGAVRPFRGCVTFIGDAGDERRVFTGACGSEGAAIREANALAAKMAAIEPQASK